MDDRILINPENRMLGNSGSNDFSLYGAQPDPAVIIGPAPAPDNVEDAPAGNSGPVPLSTATPASISAATEAARPTDVPAAPAPSDAAFGAPQPASSGPAADSESGGSITPFLPGAILAAFDAQGLTAPSLAEAAADSAAVPAPTVASPAVTSTAEPLAQGMDTSALGAATVAEAAADVAVSLPETVSGAAASLTEAVSGTASSLTEALPLGAAVQALPEIVAEIVPVDPLAPATEEVQDLLGADPAGGIATLVSLVSISDVLDLGAVVTEGADAAADPAADLIEMLALDATGEAAPPALDEDDGDGGDSLLAMPLPPPDDILDDGLGL